MTVPVATESGGSSAEGALRETIATYDAIAPAYSRRHATTDQPEMRRAFAERVGAGALVLDAGCGPGLDCRRLARDGLRLIGADRSRGMLDEARRIGVRALVRTDVRCLPFPDRSVDGVWCNAGLVHLHPGALPAALTELARVITDGGPLFASVLTAAGEGPSASTGAWREGPSGRRRWFATLDPISLASLLERAGFEAERIEIEPGSDWCHALARRSCG